MTAEVTSNSQSILPWVVSLVCIDTAHTLWQMITSGLTDPIVLGQNVRIAEIVQVMVFLR